MGSTQANLIDTVVVHEKLAGEVLLRAHTLVGQRGLDCLNYQSLDKHLKMMPQA